MRFGFVYIYFDVDYTFPFTAVHAYAPYSPDQAIVRPVSFKYLANLTLMNRSAELRKEVTLFLVPILAGDGWRSLWGLLFANFVYFVPSRAGL